MVLKVRASVVSVEEAHRLQYERGKHDGEYGFPPTDNSPYYEKGYAVGCIKYARRCSCPS